MGDTQVKIAFLILSDEPARTVPGLILAKRMKENRGADVRVLFFGPSVKLASSGALDEHLAGLEAAGIQPKACSANVEQYGVAPEIASRPIELLAAGAEVEVFAQEGYTVLSF